jgi:hypothetical protein
MISQSIAEIAAELFSDMKVLFVAMNGRPSLDYFNGTAGYIDALKSRLEGGLLSGPELESFCSNTRNLFLLGGIENEDEERYYHPELAASLLEISKQIFDLVIVDCGNRLDNGLAFGALTQRSECYLIMSQTESSLARWEKRRSVYRMLGIRPNAFILNMYNGRDIYPLDYVANRLSLETGVFQKVRCSSEGRRAEVEKKTLKSLDLQFKKDVKRLTEIILTRTVLGAASRKRSSVWRSFISKDTWQKTEA